MKKFYFLSFAALTVFFSSCSQSPNRISEGTIKDAVEEVLEQNMLDQSYTTIQTGYYELNSEPARVYLAKLAAAGVIDYKVERYAWWNKYLQTGSYFGIYYGQKDYVYEEHFMVSVGLSEEGKKMMVDSIPNPKIRFDEDMKQPEINLATLPESNYKKENWPVIRNPEAPKQKPDVVRRTLTNDTENLKEEHSNLNDVFTQWDTPEDQIEEKERKAYLPLDVNMKIKYDATSKKVKKNKVILKSSALKVEKARYIQTFIDQQTGLAKATAEIIVKTVEVTSAGRIIDGKFEETMLCAPVEFLYYDDKGWVIQNNDFYFEPVSMHGVVNLKQGVTAIGQDISLNQAKAQEKDIIPEEALEEEEWDL